MNINLSFTHSFKNDLRSTFIFIWKGGMIPSYWALILGIDILWRAMKGFIHDYIYSSATAIPVLDTNILRSRRLPTVLTHSGKSLPTLTLDIHNLALVKKYLLPAGGHRGPLLVQDMVLPSDETLKLWVRDNCLQRLGIRHVHRDRNVVVVEFPAGTESPGKFLGDEALGDWWSVYLVRKYHVRVKRDRNGQFGKKTHMCDLVGAVSLLNTGSLGCMLSGAIFMELLPRNTFFLVAKGGQLDDQLLLGIHVLLFCSDLMREV